jgi:hypothetical protein
LPLALKPKLNVVDSLLVSEIVFAVVVCPTVSVPNESVAGLMVSGRFPVPLSATVCGESGALSLMASEPVSAPEIAGLNVTLTVQDAPALIDDPQVLLAIAKFPVVAIEFTLTLAVLVFFSVTAFEALVVFTNCALKDKLSGAGNTIGLSATVKGSATKAAHEAPLGKLSTHTWKAPTLAICAAVTVTLSCVLLMNFTVGNDPFTETTDFEVNPVPFKVRVKLGPPGTAAAGLRLVRVRGVATVL